VKTVFLFLRQGISNRNLLRTDFLKTLKEHPDVRVVILSPIGDEASFRAELEAPNVCVEHWPRTKVGYWEKRLKNLKDYVWVSRGLTKAIRVRRLAQRGKAGLAWRDAVGSLAKGIGISEQKINGWESAIYKSKPQVAQVYDDYQPDAVVFTRLFGTNLHVVKEAKKRAVPVLCLVESWDNLICKGPFSVVPDRIAVWNQEMVSEAHELHNFPREKIDVVGVPQFDLYTDPSSFIDRREFFETFGLDRGKRLITYAASTEGFIPDEPEIIKTFYEALKADSLGDSVQLLLRLHPITSPSLRGEYYRRFSQNPNLVIQEPGRFSALHDGWDPTQADMSNLASTIHHSDVIVNIASTIAIDAAVLNKPVVSVAFGGRGVEGRGKFFGNIFEHSHYRKLVDTKGLRVVYSVDELLAVVRMYLKDPTVDASGRRQLQERLCYKLDGQAGRRAGLVVLKALGLGSPDLAQDLRAEVESTY